MTNYFEKYQYLSCFEMIDDNDNWWMPEYKYNNLYKISKKTLSIEKVIDFEAGEITSEGAYSYIVPYQDKLVFLPQNSLNVAVYNKKSNRLTTFILKVEKNRDSYGTAGYVQLGKEIYVFSSYEECLPFVLDIEILSIRYFESWKRQIKRHSKGEKWFINSVVEVDKKIFLGLYNSNIILKYDPEQDSYKCILLSDTCFSINKIYRDVEQGKLIILPNNDRGIIEIYLEGESFFKKRYWISEMGESKINNILLDEDELILLPKNGSCIEIINRKTNKSLSLDLPSEYLLNSYERTIKYVYDGKLDREIIYIFPFSTKGIICINRISQSYQLIELRIDKEKVLKELSKNHGRVFNEQKIPLNIFLDICNEKNLSSVRNDSQVGARIFNYIVKG